MKTSIINKIDKDHLQNIVDKSASLKEVLEKIGVNVSCGTRKTLNNRIERDNIDLSKLEKSRDNKMSKHIKNLIKDQRLDDSEVFVENSTYNRTHIKKRILQQGLLENKCDICGLKNEWEDKPLTMILDHINGVSNDHRIENLRFVCPNCNSQLMTHCKGDKRRTSKLNKCVECNAIISKGSTRCIECNNRYRNNNIPSRESLIQDMSVMNITDIGRKYNMSDNGVRKWCKKYSLPYRKSDIIKFLKSI